METTKYIWKNWEFLKWEDAQTHVLSHVMHYWSWVFEWIRFYETPKWPAIFKLEEHTKRLFYSANAIKMKIPFTEDEINKATIELVKKNGIKKWYIRPLAYYGYGKMWLNPEWAPTDVIIAVLPWWAYLPHESIDVKISSFIRIHPKSTVCDAKISWHYINSIMAVQELKWTKYHEALLLDFEWKVAEWPWENLFMIKDWKVYTPKAWRTLDWLTAKVAIEIMEKMWLEVIKKDIMPEELFEADECFYTGTAAEITPINSIDDNIIWKWWAWKISLKVKKAYFDIIEWRDLSFEDYLSYC